MKELQESQSQENCGGEITEEVLIAKLAVAAEQFRLSFQIISGGREPEYNHSFVAGAMWAIKFLNHEKTEIHNK